MKVSDAKRRTELESEHTRLKRLLVDALSVNAVTREVFRKTMMLAPLRREVERAMVTRGMSERQALTVVRMSASALQYTPRQDRHAHCVIASSPWRTAIAATVPA